MQQAELAGTFFPALAVAERLRADGHEVIWLGTETRIESRVVPQAGFEFIAMAQAGLRGGRLLPKLAAPVRFNAVGTASTEAHFDNGRLI